MNIKRAKTPFHFLRHFCSTCHRAAASGTICDPRIKSPVTIHGDWNVIVQWFNYEREKKSRMKTISRVILHRTRIPSSFNENRESFLCVEMKFLSAALCPRWILELWKISWKLWNCDAWNRCHTMFPTKDTRILEFTTEGGAARSAAHRFQRNFVSRQSKQKILQPFLIFWVYTWEFTRYLKMKMVLD